MNDPKGSTVHLRERVIHLTGAYRRACRKWGQAAVDASIEQWREGNSERPLRLAESFAEGDLKEAS